MSWILLPSNSSLASSVTGSPAPSNASSTLALPKLDVWALVGHASSSILSAPALSRTDSVFASGSAETESSLKRQPPVMLSSSGPSVTSRMALFQSEQSSRRLSRPKVVMTGTEQSSSAAEPNRRFSAVSALDACPVLGTTRSSVLKSDHGCDLRAVFVPAVRPMSSAMFSDVIGRSPVIVE
uniref:Uncharacterized protein n=1 Tax=Ixodes ricinus TaxID=34613 RepID=A0A6B0UZ57_IXORI